jgi:transposase
VLDAHVRRKFYDLEQAHASPLAREALERIAALHAIEDDIRGRPPDERQQVRQTRTRPSLRSLHDWLEASLTKSQPRKRGSGSAEAQLLLKQLAGIVAENPRADHAV